MSRLRSFGAFWWDFVVGDDPWLAVGTVLGLAATAAAHGIGIPAWWVLPGVTVALLSWSATRAAAREPVAPGVVDDESLAGPLPDRSEVRPGKEAAP